MRRTLSVAILLLAAMRAGAQSCVSPPTEAQHLTVAGAGASQLSWWPAGYNGGSSVVVYDALRSTEAGNFLSASCLVSSTTNLSYTESAFAGSAFYLVRSRNACGGTLGIDSSGNAINGVDCPPGAGGVCFSPLECSGSACCSGYCRDLATDPDHCTTCSTVCDAATTVGRGCDGTRCTYAACAAGRLNCNSTAPDTNGCECAGTACCGTGCQKQHMNGLGQTWFDCNALGVPGNQSTYTFNMAAAARAAWPVAGTDMTTYCLTSVYFDVVLRQTASSCAVWAFTGPYAGFVLLNTSNNICYCPSNSNMIWR